MTNGRATSETADARPLPGKRLRVAFVCNRSFGLNTLYRGLFAYLRAHEIDSEAIVGDDEFLDRARNFHGVPIHIVPMVREPSPIKDIVSLVRLIAFFARNRYDVVHVSTPKTAFMAAIAARLTGHRRILFVVRIRIYQDRTGLQRWLYEKVDWVVSRLSTVVAPVSPEMGEVMVADGVCPASKLRIFAEGSSNGIDIHHFSRSPERVAQGTAIRRAAGVPDDAPLMLWIGRLARGKGVHHLPTVMDRFAEAGNPAWLMLAGPVDEREPTEQAVLDDLDARPNVVRLGFQADPAPLYAAADLVLFPSSREGFANVTLEAQATELPVVGFDTFGVREPVKHGVTGLIAPLGDTEAFAANALRLMSDTPLRERMGQAAVERVRSGFSNERVWSDIAATLIELAEPSARRTPHS